MPPNLDRFKNDLNKLVYNGNQLLISIRYECSPDDTEKSIRAYHKERSDQFIKELPQMGRDYQRWYSEALALLRQLLPDRLTDFARHYNVPVGRKTMTNETYRIEDYLQGLTVIETQGLNKKTIVGLAAAIPHLEQQVAIIAAAQARFESSLFEIRQLVQADLLDSELGAAEELAKHKFVRAAGAVAGVVLEKHLAQVCDDHKINISKKTPTISVFNESLKAAEVINLPQFRFIQHLADIRNLCDHGRKSNPTDEQVADLLAGVRKITKTVF